MASEVIQNPAVTGAMGADRRFHAQPALSVRSRLTLAVQRGAGRIAVAFYAPTVVFLLRVVMAYRIDDLRGIRRRFQEIREQGRHPLLICPNHLTMIDSAIVAWALASPWRYVVEYDLLPWNLPEQTNFANPLVRVFCYLAKCLPIRRGGGRQAQRKVLARCSQLLRSGEPVLVFPEGRRSRTGRIDPEQAADGIGRLFKSVPECRVLCIYLRGRAQAEHSGLPRRAERFSLDMALIRPRSRKTGIRASREITTAILDKLKAMEEAYYARRQ